MSRKSIKENRIKRLDQREEHSDIPKPTRFDNSHKPRKIDYLDADDGRKNERILPHMKRAYDNDFEESVFLHDIVSMVVHVIFVILLVVIGILKLKIFPVVVLAVLIIMLLIGFLLRQAPFFVPFGIAILAIIVGILSNNIESILLGIPAMYGMIILTRDL